MTTARAPTTTPGCSAACRRRRSGSCRGAPAVAVPDEIDCRHARHHAASIPRPRTDDGHAARPDAPQPRRPKPPRRRCLAQRQDDQSRVRAQINRGYQIVLPTAPVARRTLRRRRGGTRQLRSMSSRQLTTTAESFWRGAAGRFHRNAPGRDLGELRLDCRVLGNAAWRRLFVSWSGVVCRRGRPECLRHGGLRRSRRLGNRMHAERPAELSVISWTERKSTSVTRSQTINGHSVAGHPDEASDASLRACLRSPRSFRSTTTSSEPPDVWSDRLPAAFPEIGPASRPPSGGRAGDRRRACSATKRPGPTSKTARGATGG